MADKYENYSKDDLIRLLRERDRKPRFGLVWERDEIDHDKSVHGDFVALDLQEDLSCGDAPYSNLLIEGDNFDALRYLRMTHAGKVKCIYIDPPYNTGNKDFIYNDHFVDKDDLYKHSKWLEYMYRRLEIARDLLTEDGIIFASIDDLEGCHLRLLMDQVFGENRFIGQFVWKSRQNKDNRTKNGASIDHEYVLAYGGNIRGVERDSEQFKNPDNDPRGAWTSGNMVGLADEKARPNLHYDLIHPETGVNYKKPKQGWRFDKNRMAQLIKEERILWPEKPSGRPRLKAFLSEMQSEHTGYSSLVGRDIYTYHGTRELDDIFDQRVFAFPKPSDFILELLQQGAYEKDAIILDFFGGSGTTAHAVAKLNARDGGNRRFIVVSSTEESKEMPDKNVCRDICAKRIHSVLNGYKNKEGQKVEGLGGNFAYLRARRIPIETIFTKVQHDQVWSALQLIHAETLAPYQKNASFQIQETEKTVQGTIVIYLPKITETALGDLKKKIKGKEVVIYSWQPALLKERFEKSSVTVEPIPQFLFDRFGAGAKK